MQCMELHDEDMLSAFEGTIAYATYVISAGKIEGTNNKIKSSGGRGMGILMTITSFTSS